MSFVVKRASAEKSSTTALFGCFKRYLRQKLVHRGGDHFSYGSKPWLPKFQSENKASNNEWNQPVIKDSPFQGIRKQAKNIISEREEVIPIREDDSLQPNEPYPRYYVHDKFYKGNLDKKTLLHIAGEGRVIEGGVNSLKRCEVDPALLVRKETQSIVLNPLEKALTERLNISHYPAATIIQMVTDRAYVKGRLPCNDRLVYLGNAYLEMFAMQRNIDKSDSLDDFLLPDGSDLLEVNLLSQVALELGLQYVLRVSKVSPKLTKARKLW